MEMKKLLDGSTLFKKTTSIIKPALSPHISFISVCLFVCVPCWGPSCETSLLIHALNSCHWPMCNKTSLCSHKTNMAMYQLRPCLNNLVMVQNTHHIVSG